MKAVLPITPWVARVAAIIRAHVPRPDAPMPFSNRFRFDGLTACPMGLVPGAEEPTPVRGVDFAKGSPLFCVAGIWEFARWWDAQTDVLAAMDVVWPPVAG